MIRAMQQAPATDPRGDDDEARADAGADALRERGVALLAMPALPWAALREEGLGLQRAGRLRHATTGRGDGRRDAGLRGDATAWIDPLDCGDATAAWWSAMDALRFALNRRLLLGMESLEAHFACYPPGAGYARHRDRFADDDARVLSLVCYLNADWPDAAGGALRLHLPDGARDIAPRAGTVVLFLSDEVEHEVLASTRERWSIAGWFRRRPR
jgi:SM-20-related protein